jgi:hypothetical protein
MPSEISLNYAQFSVTLIALFVLLIICFGVIDYLVYLLFAEYFRRTFVSKNSNKHSDSKSQNKTSKYWMHMKEIIDGGNDIVGDNNNKNNRSNNDYYFPIIRRITRHVIFPLIKSFYYNINSNKLDK